MAGETIRGLRAIACLFLVGPLAVTGSCSPDEEDEKPVPPTSCVSSCPPGYLITADGCQVGCQSCPQGTECLGGFCLAPNGPYDGDPCATAADCPTGGTCETAPLQNYCYRKCETDDDCLPHGLCIGTSVDHKFCQRPCNPYAADSCGHEALRCWGSWDSVWFTPARCMTPCTYLTSVNDKFCENAGLGATCNQDTGLCDDLIAPCSEQRLACHELEVLECSVGGDKLTCVQECPADGRCVEGECFPYRPEPNGVHISETQACNSLLEAFKDQATALGCSKTIRPCPQFLRVQFTVQCMEYDEGSVQGCVDFYEAITNCSELVETDCAVTAYPGTEPAGCP